MYRAASMSASRAASFASTPSPSDTTPRRAALSRRHEVLVIAGRTAGARGTWRRRVLLTLEVAEDRPGIDAEVARRLGAVAVVALEDLENVTPLEILFRLLQRDDGGLVIGTEVEIVGPDQVIVTQHQRLLDAILELANVAGPIVFA